MVPETPDNHRSRIVRDPKILAGVPVLEGSRIPVELVIEQLAHGLDFDAVLEEYPSLTEDDLRASLLHAREVLKAAARNSSSGRRAMSTHRVPRKKHTAADLAAFLSSAGGWAGVDTDGFLEDIYESRDRLPGPSVRL